MSTAAAGSASPAGAYPAGAGLAGSASGPSAQTDIAGCLVIATGKKKGQHPSPDTVMRMLREHDEKAAAVDVNLIMG